MRVGIIGWRGMVGSVLMQRMRQEKDFQKIQAVFFSTSQVGQPAPEESTEPMLYDAYHIPQLKQCDILLTTQGGQYTQAIYPELRKLGWKGIWIDAASTLRMDQESVIVLDPVNRSLIDASLHRGGRVFVGGNCTVSCMLMGLAGLFKADVVQWMTTMTYQAASGGGVRHMRELIRQFGHLYGVVENDFSHPSTSILEIDQKILQLQRGEDLDCAAFGVPLAGNLIPWIDSPVANGQTREEWKSQVEANKILGRSKNSFIPIDGLCVRVGAMRSHSQALTFKLKYDIPLDEIEGMIQESTPWTQLIPNTQQDTIHQLTPVACSGSLSIPVGRVHKMTLGPEYLSAFTVGDQLLWGAAEPLRRMLLIAVDEL